MTVAVRFFLFDDCGRAVAFGRFVGERRRENGLAEVFLRPLSWAFGSV